MHIINDMYFILLVFFIFQYIYNNLIYTYCFYLQEARTNYRNFKDLIWNLIYKKNFNDLEKVRYVDSSPYQVISRYGFDFMC